MEIKIYPTPAATSEAIAAELIQLVGNYSGDEFNVALSGGSSPQVLFDVLSNQFASKIPWGKIHFWWGDERCVPPEDNDSNFKMAKEHLLNKIGTQESLIHRIKGELTPEDACLQYINEIESSLPSKDGFPVFDLILLGMGTDGHTASIFPNQMELLDSEKICEVATFPTTGQKRVTLSGKVINNANAVFFLVTGSSKKDRVYEIIKKKDSALALPSYYIHPSKGKLVFYFDQEAAERITEE